MLLKGKRWACIATILIWASALSASTTCTLPQCAAQWGELMVQQCLVEDLFTQAERATRYATSSTVITGIEQLRGGTNSAREKLLAARQLYTKLYRQKATTDTAALTAQLHEIALSQQGTNDLVQVVLQQLGDQLAGKSFRALPVSDETLAPNWNPQADIGADYKPTRILLGSTAEAGDDRLLPLRFDFGRSLFSFYAPMASENDLVLTPEQREHRSPTHEWMKQHHSGYHYWAGVYNNQNTYIAPWFHKAHGNEDDVWLKLANGKLLRSGSDWGQINIWNPSVQQYMRTYCETQARLLGADPSLVCYDYSAEPHPWGSQPHDQPGLPEYSGYNDSAITAFRDWLKDKFGTIQALNDSWKTRFADFAAIAPPTDPYIKFPTRVTPVSYEFDHFRRDGNSRFWKLVYDAYRRQDSRKPIVANASMFMSSWPLEALDAWQMQKVGVADWIDMHMNNFPPNLPEQIYLYSFCRLTGRTPVQFEYIWTFPRSTPFDDNSESDFQSTCKSSVWRNLVWGKRSLVLFDAAYDWPSYHNAFLDRDLDYSILRPAICVVPTVKRRAMQYDTILASTEITTPPIIVLQPSSSVWNSPPDHPHNAFSHHTNVASVIHSLLFPKNYPFLYVPEEAVLEDHYPLGAHQAIVLPAAPYLPRPITDALLSWIKAGGTLICCGPAGMWDPYGNEDGRLMDLTFGKNTIRDKDSGHWKWSWHIDSPAAAVEKVTDTSGTLLAAQAPDGKGTILVSLDNFEPEKLRQLFYSSVDNATKRQFASCANDNFELVTREDTRGSKYLFVLNSATRDARTDSITIPGKLSRCVDLGIGSGIPVPIHFSNTGTSFSITLGAGDGTVIKLEK